MGVPLAIILYATEDVIKLIRAFAGQLPHSSLQEMLFQNGDPRLEDVKRKDWGRPVKLQSAPGKEKKDAAKEAALATIMA